MGRERAEARQDLEWALDADVSASKPASHARRQVLASENSVADRVLQPLNSNVAETFGRVMGRDGATSERDEGKSVEFGRKNILAREKLGSNAYDGESFVRVMGR